jgi:hypothetical protein
MIRLALGALVAVLVAPATDIPVRHAAAAGPAWISIEYPVNPHDPTTRDALLLVHAFHHGTAMQFPVSGTAEGIVDGQRQSVKLEFTSTSRTGVYALRRQWAAEGTWTLVISVRQSDRELDVATAVVDLAPSGEVAAVQVPVRRQGQWSIPEPVRMSDVEAGLQRRAAALARG